VLTIRFPVLQTKFSRMTQTTSQLTQFRDLCCTDATNSLLRKLSKLMVGTRRIQDLISFRTEHELQPSGYTLDTYTFHAFVFAIDPVANLSVDIAQFAIAGSLDGFMTPSRAVQPFAHDTNNSATMGIKPLVLEVEYRPPKLPRAFTMCVLITSWTLALVSVYVSLVAITEGRVGSTTIFLHAFVALAILGLWGGRFGRQAFGTYLGND